MRNEVPPFGGEPVPFQSHIETNTFCRFQLAQYINSDLYISEDLLLRLHGRTPYSNDISNYSVEDTNAAWRLIRSKLWRTFYNNSTLICILTQSYHNEIRRNPAVKPEAKNFQLLSFEGQIAEAKALTFQQKCDETLENAYLIYMQTAKPFSIPYIGMDGDYKLSWSPERSTENGQAYGCNEKHAVLVYLHLLNEGLIEEKRYQKVNVSFALAPKGLLRIESLGRVQPAESTSSEPDMLLNKEEDVSTIDPRAVFVVHGRNSQIRDALFAFLRSIDLRPIEWSQAVQATGVVSPYVGQILDAGFAMAQAVVVLLTPDDEARLREQYREPHDPPHETELTPQARPNVLFEAGMAMGKHSERTLIIEIGTLRPFSDVAGRHTLRMDNSTQRRQELAQRLLTAGCPVVLTGTDWHKSGDFTPPANPT